MKKIFRLLLVTILFTVGLASVNAKPFTMGDNEYDTLKDAVDAAPTDGTLTIITMTEDVTLAPGVQVVAGKNLVIDFGGHTYETWEPMVGSSGTETQSFQLLKGANVYMENGTLIASTHERSRMFIQNYADLTLDNITIDATTNTYDYFYAVSSNNGEVVFRGNTTIRVNRTTHARAFDMCWAPNNGYPDGTQITVDTTGTIDGIIELDLWGTWADDPKSTLLIKNGTFNVKWDIDERLAGGLRIDGGTFKVTDTIFLDDYTTEGKSAYTADQETFVVIADGNITFDEEHVYIQKGKTYTFNPNVTNGYANYVEYRIANEDVATFANGVITGVEVGNTSMNVSLGRKGASFAITVFEVKPAASADEEEAELNDGANDVTSSIVEQALTEENVEGLDEETVENIKIAVAAGKAIETEVSIDPVEKNTLPEETVTKLENEAKKADGTIAGYLDIDVLLKTDSEELGNVTKLDTPITITVDVDEELGEVPENMTRTYFVVRMHNGEVTLLEATYNDGKLSFETDRFSQYAYGYTDTNTNIPKTGDNIVLYIVLLAVSTLGIAGSVILSKKRLISITK